MAAPKVLVVEDDERWRVALTDWLTHEGVDVVAAANGRAGLDHARGCDVALLDVNLPDVDGFEVLRQLTATDPELPAIMMTGHGSVDHAVEAMKRGAFHYVTKPVDLDVVGQLVARAAAVGGARRRRDRPDMAGSDPSTGIIGHSPAMAQVRAMIRKLGRSGSSTVLITGESGTGKDVVARALHAVSPRANGPFVTITCTALPSNLLESELFGHERGAFTDAKTRRHGLLEQAAGGSVFLDEIGDMDPALQAKLLRALEDKRFRRIGGSEDLVADVRVIAATNVDLKAAIAANRFRTDLYYRLAVLTLHMPPLRTHSEDVEPLVRRFVANASAGLGVREPQISAESMRALVAHTWPGNVRELRNVVERAVVLAESGVIEVADLQLEPGGQDGAPYIELPPTGLDLRAVERDLVDQAVRRTRGNITHASRLLGISRDQMRYRMQKFSLDGDRS